MILTPEQKKEREDADRAILVINLRGTASRHQHASGCDGTTSKKKYHSDGKIEKVKEPCKICAENMRWFAELPKHHLTECLTEPSTVPATFSFLTLILDSTFTRGTHKGSRAMRDRTAGLQLLKHYEDLGGKLPRN